MVALMHDHDKTRPVSGEIMSAPATGKPQGTAGDYTDAEFEILDKEVVADVDASGPENGFGQGGMDFLAGQAKVAQKKRQAGGAGFWLSAIILVLGAFWFAGGHALVRQVPIPAFVEREGPLRLADINSRVEEGHSVPVLFIDGAIENRGTSPRVLPTLNIAVIDSEGTSTSYFLGTHDRVLEPGGRYDFSSRLTAPGTGVASVSVTFQEDMP